MSKINEQASSVTPPANEREYDIVNVDYVSFEKRQTTTNYQKWINIHSVVSNILVQCSKIPGASQELVKTIGTHLSELEQFTNDKGSNPSEKEAEEIIREIKEKLNTLKEKLSLLPYSDHQIVNKLVSAINLFLGKLADFFMNGPLITEGRYIPNPSKPHQFLFFHPAKAEIKALADISNQKSILSN